MVGYFVLCIALWVSGIGFQRAILQNKQTKTKKMKKTIFQTISVIGAFFFLYSCGSPQAKDNKVEMVVETVKTTPTPEVKTIRKVLSPEEEHSLLSIISTSTDLQEVYKIYMDNEYGTKVERTAHTKWEELMLAKIVTITNLEELHKIYLDNQAGTKVEKAAYAKWETLMLTKISTMTNLEDLYKIYLDNQAGTKVEKAALARYKQLGGKR